MARGWNKRRNKPRGFGHLRAGNRSPRTVRFLFRQPLLPPPTRPPGLLHVRARGTPRPHGPRSPSPGLSSSPPTAPQHSQCKLELRQTLPLLFSCWPFLTFSFPRSLSLNFCSFSSRGLCPPLKHDLRAPPHTSCVRSFKHREAAHLISCLRFCTFVPSGRSDSFLIQTSGRWSTQWTLVHTVIKLLTHLRPGVSVEPSLVRPQRINCLFSLCLFTSLSHCSLQCSFRM